VAREVGTGAARRGALVPASAAPGRGLTDNVNSMASTDQPGAEHRGRHAGGGEGGDLTRKITVTSGELLELKNTINTMVTSCAFASGGARSARGRHRGVPAARPRSRACRHVEGLTENATPWPPT
jgi:hypothetical protein